jgi:hypothetical protein
MVLSEQVVLAAQVAASPQVGKAKKSVVDLAREKLTTARFRFATLQASSFQVKYLQWVSLHPLSFFQGTVTQSLG